MSSDAMTGPGGVARAPTKDAPTGWGRVCPHPGPLPAGEGVPSLWVSGWPMPALVPASRWPVLPSAWLLLARAMQPAVCSVVR